MAGAQCVVMTDIPSQLPLLKHNIEMNKSTLRSLAANDPNSDSINVQCLPHYFGSGPIVAADGSLLEFDLILGSDIGYDLSLHSPLVKSLLELSHAETQILIVEEVRWRDIYQWLA